MNTRNERMPRANATLRTVEPPPPPLVEAVAITDDGSSPAPLPPMTSAESGGRGRGAESKYPTEGEVNDAGAREFLARHQWPVGLQDLFVQNLKRIAIRFYICDDSGSMVTNDGHRLIDSPTGKRMVKCSRWEELTCSLKFLASAAHAANAPTEFRLLNGRDPVMIGNIVYDAETDSNIRRSSSSKEDYESLQALLSEGPGGGTPLCKHINIVVEEIRKLEPQLRASGKKACIMIASDGMSTDGEVAEAMEPLQDLPVWVLVRLCTDDQKTVDYWNNIDNELELEMDVLDDFAGEARELYAHNPWLVYGEPLHRMREFGIPMKDVDLMDEAELSIDQIRRVCVTLFGGITGDYPHPEADFPGFVRVIEAKNQENVPVWDTISESLKPWINLKLIRKITQRNAGGCACSIM